MKKIDHNFLPEQYKSDNELPINHNYLKEQFHDSDEIIEQIRVLVDQGDFTLGKAVNDLEEEFKSITNCSFAIGVGSGTDAIFLALKALGIKEGDEIKAGTLTLKAIATPGHTAGSTCFSIGNHLFSGDTLFPNGPGKTGSPEKLAEIINSITSSLFTLNEDTNIFPGHGDDGVLKEEKGKYDVFASKEHPADLAGDVEWLKS